MRATPGDVIYERLQGSTLAIPTQSEGVVRRHEGRLTYSVQDVGPPADDPHVNESGNPEPLYEIGDVAPSLRPEVSKIEARVRAALVAAGLAVPEVKVAVVCLDPNSNRIALLTPDIALVQQRIAVEVDPCGPASSHGYTHRGQEDADRKRNRLMSDAGWTVIRLRLGADGGMHIGDRDVVVESPTFTKDAQASLLAAIDDCIKDRRAQVRIVKKTSRSPVLRHATVRNIGPNKYTHDGHFFGWYPDLASNIKHTMRLCVGGRYLYASSPRMRFVAEVGLGDVPLGQWRGLLEEALTGLDPASVGTTKWPWGETLFTCTADVGDAAHIVEKAGHKVRIDDVRAAFTTNCADLNLWSPECLGTEGGVIAALHPDAIALGYRIVEVEIRDGRYGPYQQIVVERPLALNTTDESNETVGPDS